MTKRLFPLVLLILVACHSKKKSASDYVNPFIGTGGHGHTYPGVTTPFGMVQLSPDTRLEGWDGCGGYHYSDNKIFGFSHTHLSGTGIPDYGDVLLMPTSGELLLNNGADGNAGYASKFSHKNEIAKVGFYQVFLEDYNINVELTTSPRVGFHKYTFPKNKPAQVVIDLEHRDSLLNYNIQINDGVSIQGIRYSNDWAKEQKIHFYMQFSEKITDTLFNYKKSILGISFGKLNTPLLVKVGISAVSIDGAKANMQEEIPNWDFEKTKIKAQKLWKEALLKIQVEGESETQKEIFYTALYHSLLNPNLYVDVDGMYNGTDLQKHYTDDTHYTIFSLWDTFRATHPLFTLIEQKRTAEFIRTFLRQFKDGGQLPVWELAANYTGCMIGYHCIPVITDAFVKGINDFDVELALRAMIHSATQDDLGLKSYKENGFISASEEPESVSKTLEYAYDDWCIALMAEKLVDKKTAAEFYQRAQNYKNLYDPKSGFFRAKRRHSWFAPFKPEEVNFNYTEANAWQYSLFVPQDIQGHIELMGGTKKYEEHLDGLFAASTKTSGREQADITGLIGQYAHGNEPSHHMAYLYNYVGKPWKTQNVVRQILDEQYTNAPDGLSGNEDCGQMSAWYVLSAMGFYSVTPGLNYYTIGTPLFKKITLNLENGNTFSILASNVSNRNIYIQSATLNEKDFNQSFIKHKTIMNGGSLVFTMGSKPSEWGSNTTPLSSIKKNKIIPVPFFVAESQTFTEQIAITLGSSVDGDIYYTTDGSLPNNSSIQYTNPILIFKETEIKAITYKEGKQSKIIAATYYKIDNKKSILLHSQYANQYAASGDNTLIDHLRGGKNYRTGNWQGYREDVEVIVNLGEVRNINTLALGCLQDIRSWIFYPKQVKYWISTDGKIFDYAGEVKTTFADNIEGSFTNDYSLNVNNLEAKYIKIKAENYGVCPNWHLGAGGVTWIFIDEVIIK